MPRHLFLAALLVILLAPGQAAAASKVAAPRQPRLAAPPAKAALQKRPAPPRSGPNQKVRQTPFVRLCRMIVDNRYLFRSFADLGLMAFDPNITDRILLTPETRWAFGRLAFSLPRGASTSAPRSAANREIAIQPLDVDAGPFTPFFGNPFRPLPGIWLIPRNLSLSAIDMEPDFEADSFQPSRSKAHAANGSGLHASGNGTDSAPLAYRYAMDKKTSVNAKVEWIQNLGDTTGMKPDVEEPRDDGSSTNKLPGVNLNLGASYKSFTLTGGYIRALDNRTSADLAAAGEESNPVAWSSELAYSTELMHRETTLAFGYLRASDGLHAYLPEERYRTRASMAISDSAILSLEYYLDREDVPNNNGDTDGYGITTKIGFGF
ncbi:MAG: hypothetical protein LBD10_12335 [Desulfobulbus sp.]|jgi:hypothetical protein|uniref:hypothetical protein n=1 Tax=Desulfobulbus sp. TaxID=895 RepID=UPI002849FBAC|nr:hypothetical protein [Desulfobulbus sp.]MDR2550976.1 hypothetical protein [Desulfobulbus sp.]